MDTHCIRLNTIFTGCRGLGGSHHATAANSFIVWRYIVHCEGISRGASCFFHYPGHPSGLCFSLLRADQSIRSGRTIVAAVSNVSHANRRGSPAACCFYLPQGPIELDASDSSIEGRRLYHKPIATLPVLHGPAESKHTNVITAPSQRQSHRLSPSQHHASCNHQQSSTYVTLAAGNRLNKRKNSPCTSVSSSRLMSPNLPIMVNFSIIPDLHNFQPQKRKVQDTDTSVTNEILYRNDSPHAIHLTSSRLKQRK
jgi:hypothetical protein